MKITTILVLSACLTASAAGIAQKVTLIAKKCEARKSFPGNQKTNRLRIFL